MLHVPDDLAFESPWTLRSFTTHLAVGALGLQKYTTMPTFHEFWGFELRSLCIASTLSTEPSHRLCFWFYCYKNQYVWTTETKVQKFSGVLSNFKSVKRPEVWIGRQFSKGRDLVYCLCAELAYCYPHSSPHSAPQTVPVPSAPAKQKCTNYWAWPALEIRKKEDQAGFEVLNYAGHSRPDWSMWDQKIGE